MYVFQKARILCYTQNFVFAATHNKGVSFAHNSTKVEDEFNIQSKSKMIQNKKPPNLTMWRKTQTGLINNY